MNIFKRIFKRKGKQTYPQDLSWNEIINIMYDTGLKFDGYEIVDVKYNADKTARYIILSSEKGFLTYQFEKLTPFDEETLQYFSSDLPAYWLPISDFQSHIFNNKAELLKELVFDSAYKELFEEN